MEKSKQREMKHVSCLPCLCSYLCKIDIILWEHLALYVTSTSMAVKRREQERKSEVERMELRMKSRVKVMKLKSTGRTFVGVVEVEVAGRYSMVKGVG